MMLKTIKEKYSFLPEEYQSKKSCYQCKHLRCTFYDLTCHKFDIEIVNDKNVISCCDKFEVSKKVMLSMISKYREEIVKKEINFKEERERE